MNSNDLQNRIAIYKYDRSKNAANTPVEQFLFYKYTYASIKVISGSLTQDSAPGTISEYSIEMLIRYDSLIDYNCKVVYEKNSYRIDYIEQVTRKGFMKLRCSLYNESKPYGND